MEPGDVAVDPYIVIVPVDFSNTPAQNPPYQRYMDKGKDKEKDGDRDRDGDGDGDGDGDRDRDRDRDKCQFGFFCVLLNLTCGLADEMK